jgi:signal transduction histidine kinase
MIKEISGRTSNTVVRYVERYRPEALPQLIEDFDYEQLTDMRSWISYQTANLLYRRAEKIFNRDDIMIEIGRHAATLHTLGLAEQVFRMASSMSMALSLSSRYANLLATVSQVSVLGKAPGNMRIEDRSLPGFIRTRGCCNYVKGLFYALLSSPRVHASRVTESHCSVPIWEKGLLDGSYFTYERGQIWRHNLLNSQPENLGPLAPDRTFAYGGTVYGAPSCIYDIHWQEHPRFWQWLLNIFFYRPQLLENIRAELIDEHNVIESQHDRLRQTNQVLANLLKERTELNANLEDKVAERTRELGFTIERLKELDQMKSSFLSVTSHELRTPLTVIKGALSLFVAEGSGIPPEKIKKYVTMASNNCDRLIKLIDELLDFSRLESGVVNLDLKSLNLIQLVKDTLEEFRPLAVERRLNLTSVLPAQLTHVLAHPGRIKQVLSNLLSNAMKFTPAGGEVKVLLRRVDEFVELLVADTGIGMTENQQKQAFSRFFQVDDSLTREVTGVGLGLAIVKELVEMHDGYIWVESEVGQGTRFFVRLPISGPRQSNAGKEKKTMHEAP